MGDLSGDGAGTARLVDATTMAVAGELVAVAVFGVASGVQLGAAGSRSIRVPIT